MWKQLSKHWSNLYNKFVSNAISVQNLVVELGNNLILNNISFTIDQGELTYLIGGNGSGKTTLIKTILGLIKPIQGEIKIFAKPNSSKAVAKYFGYVPQYSNIERDFPISVAEMIELECSTLEHCSIKPHEHLRYFHAEHLKHQRLSALSGGEFQKVLIARAFVSNPEIIILDEPLNNLDKQSQQELLGLISKLHEKEHKTIIMITHDHNVIKNHNRVMLLDDGKLYQDQAEAVIKQYLTH